MEESRDAADCPTVVEVPFREHDGLEATLDHDQIGEYCERKWETATKGWGHVFPTISG